MSTADLSVIPAADFFVMPGSDRASSARGGRSTTLTTKIAS